MMAETETLVHPAEVADLLRWREEDVRALMGGAFAEDAPDGGLHPRRAFGLYVLGLLSVREVLKPELAVRAAVHAASGARLDEDKDLMVGWAADGKPVVGWFATPPDGAPLRQPVVTIPGDRMWSDFLMMLAMLRDRAPAGAH